MARTIIEQTIVGLIVALILTALGYLYGLFFPDFIVKIAILDKIVLLLVFVFFLIVAMMEISVIRTFPSNTPIKRYMLTVSPYFASLLLFSTMVSRSPSITTESALAIPLLVLLTFRFSLYTSQRDAQSVACFHARKLGFAATSVLVLDDGDPAAADFLLVMNRNLNKPVGLWVGPGGRFYPDREDPNVKLIRKIEDEVGLEAVIVGGQVGQLPVRCHDLSDDGTSWLPAPIFLLREKLGKDFTHNSREHLDFVYLCRASRRPKNTNVKYAASSQITVKVCDCLASKEATQTAVVRSIDNWTNAQGGPRRAQRNDVQDDLIWRLYLAAQMYTDITNDEDAAS